MRQGRWQKPRGSSRQRLRLRVRAGVFPLRKAQHNRLLAYGGKDCPQLAFAGY